MLRKELIIGLLVSLLGLGAAVTIFAGENDPVFSIEELSLSAIESGNWVTLPGTDLGPSGYKHMGTAIDFDLNTLSLATIEAGTWTPLLSSGNDRVSVAGTASAERGYIFSELPLSAIEAGNWELLPNGNYFSTPSGTPDVSTFRPGCISC